MLTLQKIIDMQRLKKYMKGSFILLAIAIFLLPEASGQYLTEQTVKLDKVVRLIDAYYVDTVNQEKLIEDVIVEMMKNLDPHSVYISKDEVKDMNEPLVGNFEGIGIQFNILFDTIFVIAPISGGPSEKVGLRAGDRIIKIEGENVAGVGISTKGVRDRLLGKKGTKVNMSIKRRSVEQLLDFTITRDKIPIFSLDAAYMVDNDIGYVRFNRFSATTMEEFHEAIDKLEAEGLKDLILDLRVNGGGMLEAAIRMADEFMEKEKLIVYMEGSHLQRQDFVSSSRGRLKNGRVIILIDEGSASASEIVAGAIQDWDRGMIIGRRSFGKGLVQKPFYLPDGSLIRLTIARYYTPSGRLIQKSYDQGFKEYAMDLNERYENGEFISADSIHFPDSLKFYTKLNHRTVYGGGGIMPDIFVPLDTTANFAFYNKLVRTGVIMNFVLNYVDTHRDYIKNEYPDFDKYKEEFRVDDDMIQELFSMADKEGIAKDESSVSSAYDHVRLVLKALIARDTWNMSEYYELLNEKDNGFLKAVEILKDTDLYKNKLVEK